MKIWVFIAASSRAVIYFYNSIAQTFQLTRQVRSREFSLEGFARYLSEEMEIACGAGTNAGLVVCAEPKMLPKLIRGLSLQVKPSLLKGVKMPNLDKHLRPSSLKANPIVINQVMALL